MSNQGNAMALLLRRRAMMESKPYIELEAIETTGTQWADTGVFPEPTDTLYAEITPLAIGKVLYGSRQYKQSGLGAYMFYYSYDSTGAIYGSQYISWAADAMTQVVHLVSVSTKMSIMQTKGVVSINGSSFSITSGTTSAYASFAIGTSKGTDGIDSRMSQALYHAISLVDSSGNQKFDIIPVQLLTGEIGFWDKVSNTFLSNQGTDEFIPHYKS